MNKKTTTAFRILIFLLCLINLGCDKKDIKLSTTEDNIDEICTDSNKYHCPAKSCFTVGHPCQQHEECFSGNTWTTALNKCKNGDGVGIIYGDAEVGQICSHLDIGNCNPDYCFIEGHPCERHEECFSRNTHQKAIEYCKKLQDK